MKVVLLTLKTSRETWADEALKVYTKKLKPFFDFEIQTLKSKALSRDSAAAKIQQEQEQILRFLKPQDMVVVLDEKGWLPKSSLDFSRRLVRLLESGKPRLVFVIGGAYGLGEKVLERADLKVSLSPLTMNHFVAQVCTLEQIYRALCIWKGIPYHNI